MTLDFTSDINKDFYSAMNYKYVDGFIVRVHWWFLGGLAGLTFINAVMKIAATYPSPFSWRVISLPEAAVAMVFGLLSALVPTLTRGKFENHYAWRILVTFTLSIFSYLFVFISGGSIEMHFLFFVMIALIVVYSDWRLGWFMLVLVALHHGILNYTQPDWVYSYGRNDFALIAHSAPVLLAVIFTTILCENNRKSIKLLQWERGGLEKEAQAKTTELMALTEAFERLASERKG